MYDSSLVVHLRERDFLEPCQFDYETLFGALCPSRLQTCDVEAELTQSSVKPHQRVPNDDNLHDLYMKTFPLSKLIHHKNMSTSIKTRYLSHHGCILILLACPILEKERPTLPSHVQNVPVCRISFVSITLSMPATDSAELMMPSTSMAPVTFVMSLRDVNRIPTESPPIGNTYVATSPGCMARIVV